MDDSRQPLFGYRPVNWDPSLPETPDRLLAETTFQLTRGEAEYLREKIAMHCRGTLLALLVEGTRPVGKEVRFFWLHPERGEFPPNLAELVDYALRFSKILHGAALLYNLLLAEKGRYDQWEEAYRRGFDSWAHEVDSGDVRFGPAVAAHFWELATSEGARISLRTRLFVHAWGQLVADTAVLSELADDWRARELIEAREIALKGNRARLRDSRRLELWGGDSGSAQIDFRWSSVRTIINDILQGLGKGGS